MRIAILCDIHGNLPAFTAALTHAHSLAPDLLVIAGDVATGCPDSNLCWQQALDLNGPLLCGNQERYLCELASGLAPPLWHTLQFAPVQWALDQLGADTCRALEKRPTHLRLPAAPDLLVVHSSLRSDCDIIRPYTPESELAAMFPGVEEHLIVRGHNHFGQLRLWNQQHIVTCGSIGLPMDGNATAQYLLIDRVANGWHCAHQSVPYDLDAAVARFHDTGYLQETGPMGYLFLRELVTATQQFVPFLRYYKKWQDEGELALDAAVERFLGGDFKLGV